MTIQWTDAAIEAATSEAKRWREGSRFWVGKPPVYLVCRDENILSEYSDRSARDAALDDLCMRAALDAAVKAQKQSGVRDITDYMSGMADGYEKGRADALEEAAKIADEQADECDSRYPSDTARMIAADIRALKEKQGVT